ncbi:hypothetical protein E3Q24_00086 [Wallemia mellicola]|nr:hypothetical protein E3Q24_00086 [Wallemia mellicola]
MRTRLVLFDAFDTLIKPRNAVQSQYFYVFNKYNISIAPDEVKERFKVAFQELSKLAPNYGKSISWTPNIWWSNIIKRVLEQDDRYGYPLTYAVDPKTLNNIQNELLHRFASSEGYEALPGAYDTLAEIKSQGVKCGLVSNADDRILSVLESLNLKQFFSSISLSYDVGFEKPDYRIFDHALQQSNLEDIKPKHVLFLGDEYKSDYIGAQQFGIRPLLFYQEGYHKTISEDILKSVQYINNIPDVLSFL